LGLHELIRHEEVLDKLQKRLIDVGRYDKLYRHYEYTEGNVKGECDILAYSDSGYLTYYEVKGHTCPKSFDRALGQFRKFKRTHPLVTTRFVYVSPEAVKRVYLP
jgi:hypothetical protein